MTEAEYTPETPEDMQCRPVLFTDPESLRRYPNFFRSTLVGLVGSAHRTGLAGPTGSDLYTILSPAVDVFEYPVLVRSWIERRSRQAFVEALSRFKPTILHGIWPQHGRLLNGLSRDLDIPYVLSFFRPAGGIGRLIGPLAPVHGFIAATEPIRQSIEMHVLKQQERIVTIPPGCYAESETACFSDRQNRASLVMIQPLARLEEAEPFLQAVRHLLLDGFEFFLGILGSGRAESALRRRIRTLGLSSSISIVPMTDSARNVLSGADIFVRLSDKGRYDPSLVEAMSVGLAVASCPDRISTLLEDGRTGVLFDPADELSIYTALKKLLSRPEWARQLAAAAQEDVRAKHQVSRMVDLLVETYVKVQKEYKNP